MKNLKKKIKQLYAENSKISVFIYILLRTLIIVCLIRELMLGNFEHVLLCILSLFLFALPFFIEKKFKIEFPSIIEILIFLFIFSAEILGEINNFYVAIPFWDTILHTINGFLCGSIGFSLIYLLNKKTNLLQLSPIFVALVSFCFSMTIGVCWEFFEYGMDRFFGKDMQKDTYIDVIKSVTLDPDATNRVITIDGIDYALLYDKNDQELTRLNSYLDVGLYDTMNDLFVNFIGAAVFGVFGYLYIINKEKYKIAGDLMTKRKADCNS